MVTTVLATAHRLCPGRRRMKRVDPLGIPLIEIDVTSEVTVERPMYCSNSVASRIICDCQIFAVPGPLAHRLATAYTAVASWSLRSRVFCALVVIAPAPVKK